MEARSVFDEVDVAVMYGYYDNLMQECVATEQSVLVSDVQHSMVSEAQQNVVCDGLSDVQRGDDEDKPLKKMVTLSMFNKACSVPSTKPAHKRVPQGKKGSLSQSEVKCGLSLKGWLMKRVPPELPACVDICTSKEGVDTGCVVPNCKPEAVGSLQTQEDTEVLVCVRRDKTCITHGCEMTRFVLVEMKSILTSRGEMTRKVATVSWVCRLQPESQLSLSVSKGGLVNTGGLQFNE